MTISEKRKMVHKVIELIREDYVDFSEADCIQSKIFNRSYVHARINTIGSLNIINNEQSNLLYSIVDNMFVL